MSRQSDKLVDDLIGYYKPKEESDEIKIKQLRKWAHFEIPAADCERALDVITSNCKYFPYLHEVKCLKDKMVQKAVPESFNREFMEKLARMRDEFCEILREGRALPISDWLFFKKHEYLLDKFNSGDIPASNPQAAAMVEQMSMSFETQNQYQ